MVSQMTPDKGFCTRFDTEKKIKAGEKQTNSDNRNEKKKSATAYILRLCLIFSTKRFMSKPHKKDIFGISAVGGEPS